MTQEDKELLLKDLCARLPYGVKVNVIYSNENASSFRQRVCVEGDNELNTDIIGLYQRNEIDMRPYLFPLSSMTLELRCKIRNLLPNNCDISFKNQKITFYNEGIIQLEQLEKIFNLFNLYHIDYRGLIPKGIAIDATELNIY